MNRVCEGTRLSVVLIEYSLFIRCGVLEFPASAQGLDFSKALEKLLEQIIEGKGLTGRERGKIKRGSSAYEKVFSFYQSLNCNNKIYIIVTKLSIYYCQILEINIYPNVLATHL